MPKISIITPSYNCEKFLPETITSVTNQTFADWEWIICDDGSTDASREILAKIQDPRVKVLYSKKNLGAGNARNEALKEATGDFITFIDADDYWHPTFLEEMTNFMTENHAELAYCNYSRCDENMNPTIGDFKADKVVTFNNLLKTCRLSLLSSMYSCKRIGKIYFPTGTKREDHVMWLEVLKKIPQGLPYPKTLAKYRMHSNSISRKKQSIVKDQYLVYKKHMKFSTLKSLYYTCLWAINGFIKYSKIFNR